MAPWSHIAGRVVLNQGSVGGLRNQTEARCHGRQARMPSERVYGECLTWQTQIRPSTTTA
jgi:hypothetical protein